SLLMQVDSVDVLPEERPVRKAIVVECWDLLEKLDALKEELMTLRGIEREYLGKLAMEKFGDVDIENSLSSMDEAKENLESEMEEDVINEMSVVEETDEADLDDDDIVEDGEDKEDEVPDLDVA